jgi:hypothetical protein
MSTETLIQEKRASLLQDARIRLKRDFDPSEILCKNCNSYGFAIKDFSDGDNLINAHLKCTNCGIEGTFHIHLLTDDLDKKLYRVKTGLDDLKVTIEKLN